MKKRIPRGYIYPFCVIMLYVLVAVIDIKYVHHFAMYILANVILFVGFLAPFLNPRLKSKIGW